MLLPCGLQETFSFGELNPALLFSLLHAHSRVLDYVCLLLPLLHNLAEPRFQAEEKGLHLSKPGHWDQAPEVLVCAETFRLLMGESCP